MNASETREAQWELLFRILLSTDAKVYLEEANSNPVHQQLHPKQLSNHCSDFQGQESCRAGSLVTINAPAVTCLGMLRGRCLQTAVGWGFCTQDSRTSSRVWWTFPGHVGSLGYCCSHLFGAVLGLMDSVPRADG